MEPTAQDKRHLKRIARVQALFSWSFLTGQVETAAFLSELESEAETVEDILLKIPEIDPHIFRLAPKHDLTTFNKVDLAILRQAMYEILYTETPALVVINEAIEIAKEFASEEAPSFINGVLGTFVDELRKDGHAQ